MHFKYLLNVIWNIFLSNTIIEVIMSAELKLRVMEIYDQRQKEKEEKRLEKERLEKERLEKERLEKERLSRQMKKPPKDEETPQKDDD